MLRRTILKAGILGPAAFISSQMLWALPEERQRDWAGWGKLGKSNLGGVRLPRGFRARIVAYSDSSPVDGSDFEWHRAPDGGACFPDEGGGWIYVSNSELDRGQGGASALRFSSDGTLVDAYPILQGGERNCAGGATPWNTWLSCEEPEGDPGLGLVWECDPYGRQQAVPRPALGLFRHEAVAVDLHNGVLYMTEDTSRGCLYRYIPAGRGPGGRYDLERGELQVATWGNEGRTGLAWQPVPDPSATATPTRRQIDSAAHFNGGEGIVWHNGKVYFTTKGDNRLWRYATESGAIDIVYDDVHFSSPALQGVDNLAVTCCGDVLVAEDADTMRLVAVNPAGQVQPLVELRGHRGSEVAGPAFNPAGTHLYFSSQRGRTGAGGGSGGMTFEVTGPFRRD
jgi:secreted PhoX family phosphatase